MIPKDKVPSEKKRSKEDIPTTLKLDIMHTNLLSISAGIILKVFAVLKLKKQSYANAS
jgi:hypothetical protein